MNWIKIVAELITAVLMGIAKEKSKKRK